MPNTPQRLQWIFPRYDPPLYFVTFNTHHRRKLLATEQVHEAFVEFAFEAKDRGIGVGRYVIMPDHIHLFVRRGLDSSLAHQDLNPACNHCPQTTSAPMGNITVPTLMAIAALMRGTFPK